MDPETRQLATWERLRNEARQADQLLDHQLRRLEAAALFDDAKLIESVAASSPGKPVSSPATAAVPSSSASLLHRNHTGSLSPPPSTSVSIEEVEYQFRSAEREMSESLTRLEQTVLSMEEACRDLGPTSAAARHTERFRGMLTEKQQTRRRLTVEYNQRHDRFELAASRLSGDTRRRGGPGDDDAGAGVRILMDEQTSIQHTMNRVNGLLEQAEDTRDRLRLQRERFDSMGDRLVQIAERMPFVQNILHRIDVRRRREVVMLGTVMSTLMFVFVIFL